VQFGRSSCAIRRGWRSGPARHRAQAGVVDQHVERREFGGKGGRHRFDGGAVAHVEFEWQQRVAQFRGERIEPILAARGGDDAVAALDEGTRWLRRSRRTRL
jgi:hypothetical protein